MEEQQVAIISAVGADDGIGNNNDLLWRIPDDLKRFKKLTMGNVIIMGRKTYDSIGKTLPQRDNFIVTRQKNIEIEGAKVFDSLESAIEYAKTMCNKEIFIIGGASIYEQSIDLVDKLYITRIDSVKKADVFFPKLDNFKIISESETYDYDGLKYKYIGYERIIDNAEKTS